MLSISVIIPTLNEAATIGACLAAVHALAPHLEVIVADGGSNDGTVELARAAGATVVRSPRGRGLQLNAGAAAAHSDLLVFLHADTSLPPNAVDLLQTFFTDPQVQAAKFRLSFDVRHPLLDLAARLMWFDSVWTSFGDQTMVIRRELFAAVGGFPNWPLFEDVRMFEMVRNRTPIYTLPAEVVTSARRFVEHGVLEQLLRDVWYMLQYLVGVPPEVLAGVYEQRGAATRGVSIG